jgi:hypothetical protein
MNTPPNTTRLAVFIDADNTPPHVAEDLFQSIRKLGSADVKRIYGNTLGLTGWKAVLEKYPLVTSQVQEGKNAADIALIIDAMDFMHKKIFDGFCLVSSDRDFSRLATRLREEGLTVYGFGKTTTSQSFQQACTQFFFIKEKASQNPPAAPKQAPIQKSAPKLVAKPAPAKPVALKPAPATPKPAAAKPAKTAQPATQKYPAVNAVPLLDTVMAEAKKDAAGWVTLSEIGTILRQKHSGFKPSEYGRAQLGKLAILTGAFEYDVAKRAIRRKTQK